jgi:hypothetical protein
MQPTAQTLPATDDPGYVTQLDNMGVDMSALLDEWRLSKSYVEQYTRDFKQLDDLVDGVSINTSDGSPFVGDTTLAGLVRSIPRQSLQQLPVFSFAVNGTKNSIPALLCTYLARRFIFNEDTFGKGLLSTLQIGAEQSLTHGYAPFMAATGVMYNDFGTTLRLLHFSDTAPEPGINDANESGYHYVVANLTPSRVKKILAAAQGNPDTTWNVPALQRVLESSPRAKDYSIYESAAKQNQPGEQAGPTYQFVTRKETGPGAMDVTFCEELSDAPLRVMNNKSKWGYPRVLYLVIDPAALTPFGVSRVRLASPNQNLMNIYYGNIAAMLLLNSKPPILKRGRFTKPVQLKQGAVWETLDQNASADLKNLDNGALEQFVPFAQQFAGQIQNIMGGQTSQVNNTNGKSGFGKTGPGVKAAGDLQDTNTNQITKILENFLRQYALVGLDTLLSEQTGEDRIIVDDDTKNSINELSPGAIGDDNKILVNWERFYEAIEDWTVNIDISLSPDQLKDEKRGDLQDMLTTLLQSGNQADPATQAKIQQIEQILLEDSAPMVAAATSSLPNTPPAQQVTAPMPQAAPPNAHPVGGGTPPQQ